jgi:hypothetical protein
VRDEKRQREIARTVLRRCLRLKSRFVFISERKGAWADPAHIFPHLPPGRIEFGQTASDRNDQKI